MVLDIKKHRIVMMDIWKDIVSSPYGKILWFKWWTLLYFLYNLDRFSTDLDFDLLWKVDEQKILSDLSIICQNYGKIKDVYNKENTLFILVDYKTHDMNIKIEINKRTRKHDTFDYKNVLWYQARCMNPDCLFSNKLVALTQRNRIASRDLYDIHFFFKQGFSINEELIKERTGKSLSAYLKEILIFIPKHFSQDILLAGLWELISEKQKTFVKEKLVKEVINYIKMTLRK